MRVDIDAAGVPAGKPQIVQTFLGNFIGDFSIARDGTSVLWLFRGLANLWSVDVPSKGMAPRSIPLTSDDVRYSQPRHSSDGRIAFHQFAVGQPPTTWVIDEDGKSRDALTAGQKFGVWGPQWSPGNTRLLVIIGGPNRKPEFGWLDTATRQLSPTGMSAEGLLSPNLSPDGSEIAYHVIDEGGVLNVWTQRLDGGPPRQITFDKEAMSYPTWSPDGKSILVEIKRGDSTHIGVVSKTEEPWSRS